MAVEMGTFPRLEGLCGSKADHDPHWVEWSTVAQAGFWCHADQTRRQPWAGERKRRTLEIKERMRAFDEANAVAR